MSRVPNNVNDFTPWYDPNAKPTPTNPYADFDLGEISEVLEQQKALEEQRAQEEAIDERMTPEQIRAEFEKQQAELSAKSARDQAFRAATTFTVEEPRFISNPRKRCTASRRNRR